MDQQETIELINSLILQNDGEPDWVSIGEEIGKSPEAARSYYRRHADKYPSIKSKNSISINADGTQTSDRLILISEEERKSPRRLLELHNYDPDKWVITNSIDNLWHGQKSHKQGGGLLIHYQSKITVKPATDITMETVQSFFDNLDHPTAKPIKPKQYAPDGEVLEIALADMHKGSRSPYNESNSVEDKFRYTINDIVSRCGNRKFSKIYFVLGGDNAHFDTKSRTTTAGTQLDTDGLTATEIFKALLDLYYWGIDCLRQIAPVEVICLPGNHDWLVSLMIAMTIEAYYKDCQDVIVDTDQRPRKWRIVGCSLIGWMHGEMSKTNASSWLMAEARDDWGKTKYAEVHAFHYHSQTMAEKNGMILRYLPSMKETDEWEYEKGFVGSVKATVSFVWGFEEGLREMWYTNV